jgi:hypothetical protein
MGYATNFHWAYIVSFLDPSMRTWLITWFIFPMFCLPWPIYFVTLAPSYLLLTISFHCCICNHPIEPLNIYLMCYAHGSLKHIRKHDAINNILPCLWNQLSCGWQIVKCYPFFHTWSIPLHVNAILSKIQGCNLFWIPMVQPILGSNLSWGLLKWSKYCF